jgi:hypothetical protein
MERSTRKRSGESAIVPSLTWRPTFFATAHASSSSSLHLSREEQRRRFLERIDEPDKNWKFSLADIEERAFWPQYMQAYEACLSATSTKIAPWYVVPADDKKNARLIVSRIILETLKSLRMRYPESGAERQQELLAIRQRLMAEEPGS